MSEDKKKSMADVGFSLGFGPQSGGGTPRRESLLAIAMLGDFSGDGARGSAGTGLAERRAHRVDAETFDDVMKRIAPRLVLELAPGAAPVELAFACLEDFHPDSLVRRVAHLKELRQLRKRLNDPATFVAAAAEMQGWASAPRPAAAAEKPAPAGEGRDVVAELLAGPTKPAVADELGVSDFVRGIVSAHVTSGPDPRADDLVRQVDALLSERVRAILHHPSFQALETAWRGAALLATRLELGETLTLDLVDASKADLLADLSTGATLEASGLARRLSRGGGPQGDQPLALVVGLYQFCATAQDGALLAQVARVTAGLGVTWLAEGDAALLGCKSLAKRPDSDDWDGDLPEDAARAWAVLQSHPAAKHVGLSLPRILMRAPYGERTSPVETFSFEEIPGVPRHQQQLWGSPAVACALLLGQGFVQGGPGFDPASWKEVGDLPLHVYTDAGERLQTPCAEAWITERSAKVMLEAGIMPFQSARGLPMARLLAWRSIAQPPAALAGPWG